MQQVGENDSIVQINSNRRKQLQQQQRSRIDEIAKSTSSNLGNSKKQSSSSSPSSLSSSSIVMVNKNVKLPIIPALIIQKSLNDDKPTQFNPASFQDPKIKFLIEFSAGALGGVVSRTATAPIDRLRTVFQVQSVDSKDLNLRKLWHFLLNEGKWHSMWRGNWVNVLKTAPENAIRLATYEKLKQLLNEHNFNQSGVNTFGEKLLCGSTAGLCATLVLYPLKTVKTLMNLGHTGEYLSINHCIRQTYLMHGFAAFYKGLMAHSAAIIPSAGIDLATYETLKKKYSHFMNKSEPSVVEKLIIGSFSSCIGNLIVYPLLFARTRLQSNLNPNETTFSVLRYVWRRDGIRGIYRGFLLHIGKIGPAASISYVTFETVTKSFSLNSLT